jgi:hypothetical protein
VALVQVKLGADGRHAHAELPGDRVQPIDCLTERCHMDAERRVVFYQMSLAAIRAILVEQDPLDVPKLIELIDRLQAAAIDEDAAPPETP